MKSLKILCLAFICWTSVDAYGQFYAAPSLNLYINQNIMGSSTSALGNLEPVYLGLGGSGGYAFDFWAIELSVAGYAPRTYDTIITEFDGLYGTVEYPATESSTLYGFGIDFRFYSPWWTDYTVDFYSSVGIHRTFEHIKRILPEAYSIYEDDAFNIPNNIFRAGLGVDFYLEDLDLIFLEVGISNALAMSDISNLSTYNVTYGFGWTGKAGIRLFLD